MLTNAAIPAGASDARLTLGKPHMTIEAQVSPTSPAVQLVGTLS
jgi:hypothetical protein